MSRAASAAAISAGVGTAAEGSCWMHRGLLGEVRECARAPAPLRGCTAQTHTHTHARVHTHTQWCQVTTDACAHIVSLWLMTCPATLLLHVIVADSLKVHLPLCC
jgi:hypothetical protein